MWEDTYKGKNPMIRLVLVLFFFFTCVLIPVFNILPFLIQTIGTLESSPKIILFYHSTLSSTIYWSFFGIGEVSWVPGMVISWLEWIMPFLGMLTLILAIWVFIQELDITQRLVFSIFRKVSFLTIGVIWLEWIIFFCRILGEHWGGIIALTISLPPIPNTLLLGLMLSGTFTLLWATSATPLKIDKQVSSSTTYNLQESGLKEHFQKNMKRISLQIVLITSFFFTCVGIPFLRLMPFMQISLGEGGEAVFFFDHFSENGYIHPYMRIPYQPTLQFLLGMSGWVFIGFGMCFLAVTIYSIIMGPEFHNKTFLPVLHWLSLIAIFTIITEWFFFLLLMGDEWLLQRYQTTPFLNIPLLGIMICGVICLIIANLLPACSTVDSTSPNDIISKS
ncbi:MAG: hypothetical protein ACFFAU_12330, partial [Candidatus Hodarchaeota archaeon]